MTRFLLFLITFQSFICLTLLDVVLDLRDQQTEEVRRAIIELQVTHAHMKDLELRLRSIESSCISK